MANNRVPLSDVTNSNIGHYEEEVSTTQSYSWCTDADILNDIRFEHDIIDEYIVSGDGSLLPNLPMFDPINEREPNWDQEIRDDGFDECNNPAAWISAPLVNQTPEASGKVAVGDDQLQQIEQWARDPRVQDEVMKVKQNNKNKQAANLKEDEGMKVKQNNKNKQAANLKVLRARAFSHRHHNRDEEDHSFDHESIIGSKKEAEKFEDLSPEPEKAKKRTKYDAEMMIAQGFTGGELSTNQNQGPRRSGRLSTKETVQYIEDRDALVHVQHSDPLENQIDDSLADDTYTPHVKHNVKVNEKVEEELIQSGAMPSAERLLELKRIREALADLTQSHQQQIFKHQAMIMDHRRDMATIQTLRYSIDKIVNSSSATTLVKSSTINPTLASAPINENVPDSPAPKKTRLSVFRCCECRGCLNYLKDIRCGECNKCKSQLVCKIQWCTNMLEQRKKNDREYYYKNRDSILGKSKARREAKDPPKTKGKGRGNKKTTLAPIEDLPSALQEMKNAHGLE